MSIESGHVGTNVPKVDEWRDGMVEQYSPRHSKRSRTTLPMR